MEEKVEAKTQAKPEKKNKTRMLLVLLFLVIYNTLVVFMEIRLKRRDLC